MLSYRFYRTKSSKPSDVSLNIPESSQTSDLKPSVKSSIKSSVATTSESPSSSSSLKVGSSDTLGSSESLNSAPYIESLVNRGFVWGFVCCTFLFCFIFVFFYNSNPSALDGLFAKYAPPTVVVPEPALDLDKSTSGLKSSGDFFFFFSFCAFVVVGGLIWFKYGGDPSSCFGSSSGSSVLSSQKPLDSSSGLGVFRLSDSESVSLSKLWYLFRPNESLPEAGPSRDVSLLTLLNTILQSGVDVLSSELQKLRK